MPGLLRGVARTAVVAGTATAVSNRVSRRQANRWAEKDYEQQQQAMAQQPQSYAPPPEQYQAPQPVYQAPPPPAAPAGLSMDQKMDQLAKLGQLKDSGVLTEAEFQAEKAKILAG